MKFAPVFTVLSFVLTALASSSPSAQANPTVKAAYQACLSKGTMKANVVDGNGKKKLGLTCVHAGSKGPAADLFQATLQAGVAEHLPPETWQFGHVVEQADFGQDKNNLIARCFHDLTVNTHWCVMNLDVSPGVNYVWDALAEFADESVAKPARLFKTSLQGCYFTSTFNAKKGEYRCGGEQAKRLYARAYGYITQDQQTGEPYYPGLPMGYFDGSTVVFGADDENWSGQKPGPGARCLTSGGQYECVIPLKLGSRMRDALAQ